MSLAGSEPEPTPNRILAGSRVTMGSRGMARRMSGKKKGRSPGPFCVHSERGRRYFTAKPAGGTNAFWSEVRVAFIHAAAGRPSRIG